MGLSLSNWIITKFGHWMTKRRPSHRAHLCDFYQIIENAKPGDIWLIEGSNYASWIVQQVTRSTWSHTALYIGTLSDISDPKMREIVQKNCHHCTDAMQFVIETEVGLGTILSSVTKYKKSHVRVLRSQGLSHPYIQKVISYAIERIGKKYDVRHLLDLARFLFPWNIFPRKWRSSLFRHNALQPTKDLCSTMIAEAFESIKYPILPLIKKHKKGEKMELIQRNPELFTPSDFDCSPYFDVIKYPFFKLSKRLTPEKLPWKEGAMSDDIAINIHSSPVKKDDKRVL